MTSITIDKATYSALLWAVDETKTADTVFNRNLTIFNGLLLDSDVEETKQNLAAAPERAK